MSDGNKEEAVGPRKHEDLTARGSAAHSGQNVKGVARKAVGPRKHEDLTATGMRNSSILVILARMPRELRGKLRALENMKT